MYAIVDIAGQQFKVTKDQHVTAFRIEGDAGTEVEFDKILLLSGDDGVKVGAPYVEGAKVMASIVEHKKDKTVIVFKKKRRKGYKVRNGHRQPLTTLQIKDIVA